MDNLDIHTNIHTERKKKKIRSVIHQLHPATSRSMTFACAHVPPSMLRSSIEKTKELKFHPTEKQREEKKSEEKQRKEKKEGGKKTGVQGGVPLCAADTNFPKERKNKGLAMKGKIKRKKKRESRECPLTPCRDGASETSI